MFFNQPALIGCPGCGAPITAAVFSALFRSMAAGKPGEPVMAEGEAACFYHPEKRVTVACQACGRFLCALCDLEIDGQHLCPACLENEQSKGKLSQLENRRFLHDNAALYLAFLPLLFWPATVVTAPAAIIVAVRGWNRPSSLLPRTRFRFYAAILFALLQIAAWTTGAVFALRAYFR